MQNYVFRKGLVLGIIVIFFGAGIVPSTGIVGKSSKTTMGRGILYVGGSEPGNYSTIQSAIDDANSGDMVFVYDDSSPYYEHVLVDKSINLFGESKDTTVIDSSGQSGAIRISNNDVEISGFTLRNSGSGSRNGGKKIESSNNIISGNIISNNYGCGIILGYSSVGNTISGNIIKTNNQFGIYLDQSSGNSIKENIIDNNNVYGIYLSASSDNIITSNTIEDNDFGIYMYSSSNSNTLKSNIISNNLRYGVYAWYPHSNIIILNNISDNGYAGIRLYYSSNNQISENNICINGWNQEGGMYLTYDSNNNDIYHNNFFNNFNWNAKDECTNTWDDGYPSGGNYWSDYTGTDGDGDGIGDVPYPISGGDTEDRYPLMKSWDVFVEGIDVSHYQNEQGNINWVDVFNSNRSFAFVKATEGDGLPDDYFETNMDGGYNAGLLMGAYHLARPDLGNEAEAEAQYFIDISGDYLKSGYLRPALDLEYGEELGWETLSNWVIDWMNAIQNEMGVAPILYVNSYYSNNLDDSLNQYNLWIAHWEVEDPDTGKWDDWDFWQYTNKSLVPGINGYVDSDRFNGNLTKLNTFVISRSIPNKPTIDGPNSGIPGIEYDYIFNSVDPDDDDVKYHIDWGDTTSNITGFNPSGADVIVSHIWTETGVHIIKVKAEDSNGLYSSVGTFTVTIPRNKAIDNSFILRFLARFHMLERLLSLIRIC